MAHGNRHSESDRSSAPSAAPDGAFLDARPSSRPAIAAGRDTPAPPSSPDSIRGPAVEVLPIDAEIERRDIVAFIRRRSERYRPSGMINGSCLAAINAVLACLATDIESGGHRQ